MPTLQRLKLENFRNFKEISLEFAPEVNLIYGRNGSGKTSIVEAIHFLAYGKSFRAKELNRMIHQGEKQFILFLQGSEQSQSFQMGVQRSTHDSVNRLNGETPKNMSEFAETLPLLLIHPESFQLLTGGAKMRRALVDWGVFYHHPQSRVHFGVIRKALKQRNQALKQHAAREHVQLWETTMLASAEALNTLRREYIALLERRTMGLLEAFAHQHQVTIEYEQGWPEGISLTEAWERSYHQDMRAGCSEYGPHQADLKITARRKPAKDMLSRGQQKTLICTLKMAQGQIFEDLLGCKPLYLFDDLASELDKNHRAHLKAQIIAQNSQVILTGINKERMFKGNEIYLE